MAKFEALNGVAAFREDDEENRDTSWDVLQKHWEPNDVPVRVRGDRVINEGTFSNNEMLAAIALGHIVQYPHDPSLIGPASMDVRVGHTFFATDRNTGKKGLYNPHDSEDILRYFGEPFQAAPLREQGELRRRLGITTLRGIDPEHPLIILRPGERVLGHTHEFLGILPPGMANVYATSSKGRHGITIAQDATFINPGWVNRLVLEIKNENEDEHLPLLFGDKVAQITFHGTGAVRGTYADNGSYQHANAVDIDAIVHSWRPHHMLPVAKSIAIPPAVDGLSEELR